MKRNIPILLTALLLLLSAGCENSGGANSETTQTALLRKLRGQLAGDDLETLDSILLQFAL